MQTREEVLSDLEDGTIALQISRMSRDALEAEYLGLVRESLRLEKNALELAEIVKRYQRVQ